MTATTAEGAGWTHIWLAAHEGTRQRTVLYLRDGIVIGADHAVVPGAWPLSRTAKEVRKFYRGAGSRLTRFSRRKWERLPDWQQGMLKENWKW